MDSFDVRTKQHGELTDITRHVQAVLAKSGVKRGYLCAYVPHTTAGITINENADPTVPGDILETLDKMVPWKQSHFRHAEGNSAAHIKASLVGQSVTVPVEQGRMVLGTWQGIFFCEFDGPRTRKVYVQVHE
jgi:secondary thiamine-phosphate synthase enzyme